MEFYGNRLSEDQVKEIVSSFMHERYGDDHREPSLNDIRFALKYFLKRMTEEPNIYVKQNDQGEWIWDIIEEEGLEDDAHYDHPN